MRDEPIVTAVSSSPDHATLVAWDKLAGTSSYSDVTQLSVWAQIRRAAGFEPLYVLVHQGSTVAGGALVLTRKLPVVGRVGYVSYGPFISSPEPRPPLAEALVRALRTLAENPLRGLFVQPPLAAEDISAGLQRAGFRVSTTVGIAPAASLRLDLRKTEEELRAGLRGDRRRSIRSGQAQGVTVRQGTTEDVRLLARLHAETAQHQRFKAIPTGYLQTLYDYLAEAGHAEVFVAEFEGRPVAARLFTGCGGVLKDRLAGMDRSSAAANRSVPAQLYWEAIRWAKANGYRWFDVGGISPSALPAVGDGTSVEFSALNGPDAFKATFGAVPFRYPAPVEFIAPPLVRTAFDLSQRWPVGRRLVGTAAHLLRAGSRTGSTSAASASESIEGAEDDVGPSQSVNRDEGVPQPRGQCALRRGRQVETERARRRPGG
jgi:lipid II:glycine glycyltransferase (peptidoglycan interpeptide bridge formation enzyme)